jgi:hypothetical protein
MDTMWEVFLMLAGKTDRRTGKKQLTFRKMTMESMLTLNEAIERVVIMKKATDN